MPLKTFQGLLKSLKVLQVLWRLLKRPLALGQPWASFGQPWAVPLLGQLWPAPDQPWVSFGQPWASSWPAKLALASPVPALERTRVGPNRKQNMSGQMVGPKNKTWMDQTFARKKKFGRPNVGPKKSMSGPKLDLRGTKDGPMTDSWRTKVGPKLI